MEREELRLAEALTEEQAWEADGITVLAASVTLPQLTGKSPRAKRFNRYYRRFCPRPRRPAGTHRRSPRRGASPGRSFPGASVINRARS